MNAALDPRTTRVAIDDFLAHPRIAFVGLSSHADHFSRVVYQALRENGFDVVPVNTNVEEIAGQRCFESVEDISPPVDGALIMTPADATQRVVEQCDRAGIRRVWMHRGAGVGAVSPAALDYCREHGMSVVPGQCPMMFIGEQRGVHQAHASLKALWGTYPRLHPPPVSLATLVYAAVGWLLCGAVMYAGTAWWSMSTALVVHAVAAPLVFAALAWRYGKARAGMDPFVTAATFTGVVVALDVVVVALIIEQSFAMFASALGTWVPFLLIFLASWIASWAAERRVSSPAGR